MFFRLAKLSAEPNDSIKCLEYCCDLLQTCQDSSLDIFSVQRLLAKELLEVGYLDKALDLLQKTNEQQAHPFGYYLVAKTMATKGNILDATSAFLKALECCGSLDVGLSLSRSIFELKLYLSLSVHH